MSIDVVRDLEAFRRRVADVRLGVAAGDTIPSPAREALLAVALHGAYGALESIFARIAEGMDGGLPSGARWWTVSSKWTMTRR
jgi:hypothetical protein